LRLSAPEEALPPARAAGALVARRASATIGVRCFFMGNLLRIWLDHERRSPVERLDESQMKVR
jgi:hypothetical protein